MPGVGAGVTAELMGDGEITGNALKYTLPLGVLGGLLNIGINRRLFHKKKKKEKTKK